ncbi:DNA-formamidopyrimidine glycosylase family protein [uncultured Mucilaginibacter sp.]|uniref:DNA-formamidopyrimidine glycosylase family protein n=1 Tax=uncultured Mucilaginibacter sp. TaxID=797541 RepID=UPI0025EBB5CA|nr:DNA-formamidopyrimidine glycosylase family protein [uncultured Mucilaginibacter sp.]
MPELPDLQVFSQNITKVLEGCTLLKVVVIQTKKLNVSTDELSEALNNAKLKDVIRDGKTLQFRFNNSNVLGIHLMLHGQLKWFELENPHKFTILEMHFENGKGLALTDFQKAATPTLNPDKSNVPDALDEEVDLKFWKEKFAKSRKPVKALLTDQKIVRGIGNAYADEIFYHAKISPFSAANKIPDKVIKVFNASLKKVLEHAEKEILKSQPDIISGEVRDFFNVHIPKEDKTAKGETIRQKDLASRKTYFTDMQKVYN